VGAHARRRPLVHIPNPLPIIIRRRVLRHDEGNPLRPPFSSASAGFRFLHARLRGATLTEYPFSRSSAWRSTSRPARRDGERPGHVGTLVNDVVERRRRRRFCPACNGDRRQRREIERSQCGRGASVPVESCDAGGSCAVHHSATRRSWWAGAGVQVARRRASSVAAVERDLVPRRGRPHRPRADPFSSQRT